MTTREPNSSQDGKLIETLMGIAGASLVASARLAQERKEWSGVAKWDSVTDDSQELEVPPSVIAEMEEERNG